MLWGVGNPHAPQHPKTPEQRAAAVRLTAQWRKRNPDRARALGREYYYRHRERILRAAAERQRLHPEGRKARKHAYWARKHGAEGRWAPAEFRALVALYGGRCAYCDAAAVLEPDHAIPLSRGGTNYIDNILPTCRRCNASKCDRTVEEFLNGESRPKRIQRGDPNFKLCRQCGNVRPVSEFNAQKGKSDGKRSECRLCARVKRNRYRALHAEHYRELARSWWAKNGARVRGEINARKRT